MRVYAPVTGTEITCSPKVFDKSQIREDISEGLSLNIPTIKLDGNYYDLSTKERDYFVTSVGNRIDENVNFMYLPNWPTRIEIHGEEVIEPVGLQEGLAMLGFCYVPYHFVYDINFPVMVQFYDDDELFQFPISVIIQKNRPRVRLSSLKGSSIESPVCEYKNQEISVYTYDYDLSPVEAQIQFKCLNQVCQIGETELVGSEGFLEAKFPSCLNGFITAKAEGYATAKHQISTTEEIMANILMKKKYTMNLDLGNVDKALVSFVGEEYSTTVVYPEMSDVDLVEDYYNISVYVYNKAGFFIPEFEQRKCVDVPESGLGGLFGVEKEKCFDIELPEMEVEFAVVGGGKAQEYILEDVLKNSNEININVPLFGIPSSLEELQENHLLVEDERVYISYD